jgi:Flp pilus assembly pilin Flp
MIATLRRLQADRRGIAAVEMAFCTSLVLVPLLGGVTGFGQALELQTQLDRAVHLSLFTAYGSAASLNTSNVNSTMTTAVQNGFGNTTPSVSASLAYYCMSPTATRSGSGSATSPTCSSPNVVETYLTVNATATFAPLFAAMITWNQTGGPRGLVTISSSATVRIK